MGWYAEQLLPRLVDKALSNEEITAWRRKAVVGLRGVVVEIGFGSGLNLPVLPSGVTRVLAVEPAGGGRALAAARIAKSSIPVEHIGLDGQSIPLPTNPWMLRFRHTRFAPCPTRPPHYGRSSGC